jgi:CRP-like cAMP-binding protein
MPEQKENLINNFWGFIFGKDKYAGKTDKVDLLRKIPLFEALSRRELRNVVDIIHDRSYEADEYMFEKGQPGAAMFIIRSGTVKIVAPDKKGKEITLATLGKDTFVGELALLDDSPRSASAKAEEKTEASAFFRTDLNKLLDTEPLIASKIFKQLSLIIGQRLKATNEQLYGKSE